MQGLRLANEISLTFKRDVVIKAMKRNLERHRKIVEEANAGYKRRAIVALEDRLHKLREGEAVDLRFQLSPPVDHIRTYERMIAMLEGATNETLELSAEQHAAFVRDDWDWSRQWLESNADYSSTAASLR